MFNKINKYLEGRFRSFKYAFSGLAYILLTQKNSQIHLAATIVVIILGLYLHVTGVEFSLLLLSIAFVWMTEIFNTAVESLVDLSSPDYHPLARVSKDLAAAAVLVSAIVSAAVGIIIFSPHIFILLNK